MSVVRKNTKGGVSSIISLILFIAAAYAFFTDKMFVAGALLIVALLFGRITRVSRRKNARNSTEVVDKKGKNPYEASASRNMDALTDDDRARFISIANSGGKIMAIKQLREFSGVGLKEAKDTLEEWLLEENS